MMDLLSQCHLKVMLLTITNDSKPLVTSNNKGLISLCDQEELVAIWFHDSITPQCETTMMGQLLPGTPHVS